MKRLLLAVLLAPLAANAATINASGSFTSSAISGTWAASFSDTLLDLPGVQFFDPLPLTSLTTTSPVFGNGFFTTANSVFGLRVTDGVVSGFYVGGKNIAGNINTSDALPSDFRVFYDVVNDNVDVRYEVASTSMFASGVSGSVTAVPVPAAAISMLLGLSMLGTRLRRRRSHSLA